MSRRPVPSWLRRAPPSAKSRAAASSRDAAVGAFNSFFHHLLEHSPDGFSEAKGGGGADDDADADDSSSHKRKAAALTQQQPGDRVLRFFMRGVSDTAPQHYLTTPRHTQPHTAAQRSLLSPWANRGLVPLALLAVFRARRALTTPCTARLRTLCRTSTSTRAWRCGQRRPTPHPPG